MKAIRVHEPGEPDVLVLEEVPDPIPGDREVVVRTAAIGVNPVETYIRSGRYPQPATRPYTPGQDCAGVVIAAGAGVTRVAVGARVYTSATLSGAYAEQVLCSERGVHPLPEGVTFQQGAALGVPYGTAYRALFRRARGEAGETVLIHGASGGVGSAATQFARAAGFTVIGTAGSERGKELVRENGAHIVLAHNDPGYLGAIMDLTGGRGVDIILEMLSNVNLGKDLHLLSKRGRVVVIGSRGTVEINPRDLMSRDADIRGMTLGAASEEEMQGIHAAIVAGLETRALRPVVGRELPLAEAAHAHVAVLEAGAYGKIVLIP